VKKMIEVSNCAEEKEDSELFFFLQLAELTKRRQPNRQ